MAGLYKETVQKLKTARLETDYNLPSGFGDAEIPPTGFWAPKDLLDELLTSGNSRDFFLSKLMARGKADFAASKDAYKTILREAGFTAERLVDLNTAIDGATNFSDFQAKAKKLPKEWEAREAERERVARNEILRADEAARQAEEQRASAASLKGLPSTILQQSPQSEDPHLARQLPSATLMPLCKLDVKGVPYLARHSRATRS